jgi:hypothetical protein
MPGHEPIDGGPVSGQRLKRQITLPAGGPNDREGSNHHADREHSPDLKRGARSVGQRRVTVFGRHGLEAAPPLVAGVSVRRHGVAKLYIKGAGGRWTFTGI